MVRAFLSKPGWRVCALTHNMSSTKVRHLAPSGVEVVCANIDDPSTLTPAFDGLELRKSPSLGMQRLYMSYDLQW